MMRKTFPANGVIILVWKRIMGDNSNICIIIPPLVIIYLSFDVLVDENVFNWQIQLNHAGFCLWLCWGEAAMKR